MKRTLPAAAQRIVWGIAAVCAVLQMAWGHALALDEVEFFRATRWVSLGRVPYRDFWELHTPLQWHLFAPAARFLTGAGALPILILRWVQLPLAVLASWALWRLARKAGASAATAGVALLLLWLSRFYADSAVEYRVDVLALAAFVLALDAMWNGRDLTAGLLLAASVMANIRFAPIAAIALLLMFVIDLDAQRWRFDGRRWPALAGAAAACAAWAGILWWTGSLRAFWRHVVLENAIADRHIQATPYTAGPTLASIIGIVDGGFRPMLVDPAAIAIVIAAAAGAVLALLAIRRPTFLTFLALLQVLNLLFIARMKVVYPYHFLLTFAAAVPLAAIALERAAPRAITAVVILALAVRLFVTVFGANHGVLAWQNVVMTEADRRTRPGEPVFDGVGWVQTRPPAYEQWFLPLLARIRAGEGYARRYTVADAIANPPGAVIVEQRVVTWFQDYPSLGAYFRSHYLPLNDNLWLPGLSGRFDEAHPLARWIVPRSGTYRIVCSDPRRVTLRRNGAVMVSSPVSLVRGDHIEAVATGDAEVFVVPADVKAFFRHGPPLEAPLPAAPHLPWR